MANYTRSTNFTAKDALSSGNPSKIILGSEHDAEYDAIAVSIATKLDSTGSAANLTELPLVQFVEGTPYTTYTDISVEMPADDSVPQNTEGVELVTVTITPVDSTNRLVIEGNVWGAVASAGVATAALFKDSTASAIAVSCARAGAAEIVNIKLQHEMAAGGTSAITFKLRVGPSSGAANFYVNGSTTTRLFGGIAACRLRVTEYTP